MSDLGGHGNRCRSVAHIARAGHIGYGRLLIDGLHDTVVLVSGADPRHGDAIAAGLQAVDDGIGIIRGTASALIAVMRESPVAAVSSTGKPLAVDLRTVATPSPLR